MLTQSKNKEMMIIFMHIANAKFRSLFIRYFEKNVKECTFRIMKWYIVYSIVLLTSKESEHNGYGFPNECSI